METRAQPQASAATHTVVPTGCCPPFEPGPWQDKEIVWESKRFVKDHVRSLFHIPINMGGHIVNSQRMIAAAAAAPSQPLMLSDEASPWGSDLYIAVEHDVPGATMTTLSGTFMTHVYEGPYRDAGKWMKDMRRRASERGRQLEKLYLAYTTCPACAKAYGKNYVIVFAKVAAAAAPTARAS